MKIEIQRATLTDLAKVSEILTEASEWLLEKNEPLWKANELKEEKIRDEVEGGFYFVAYVDGAAAGVFKFQEEDESFWPDVPLGEAIYIHRVAIKRKYAGQGLSSAIMEFAKRRGRELGRKFLRLDCEASRPKLCAVYEKAGFTEHSNRQVGPYYVARYQCEIKTE